MTRGPVVIVTAADDAFAWPAALALLSADANAAGRPVHLMLIDCGISPQTSTRLREHFSARGSELLVREAELPTELSAYEDEFVSHLSPATFARVVAPRYAAEFASRTLYLDADTLTIGSIEELLDTPLGEMIVGAVADVIPVSSPGGVGGWRRLGLEPRLDLFNAGVLLVDNRRWLDADIERRVVSELLEFPQDATYGEQGSLNAVLAQHRRLIDRRWNFRVRSSPGVGCAGVFLTRRQAGSLRSLRILHFLGERKPWHAVYPPSPLRSLYRHEWRRSGGPSLPAALGYADWLRWKLRRGRAAFSAR
jgi:lipopolysaccharide biosynthesis glycosyltransferase